MKRFHPVCVLGKTGHAGHAMSQALMRRGNKDQIARIWDFVVFFMQRKSGEGAWKGSWTQQLTTCKHVNLPTTWNHLFPHWRPANATVLVKWDASQFPPALVYCYKSLLHELLRLLALLQVLLRLRKVKHLELFEAAGCLWIIVRQSERTPGSIGMTPSFVGSKVEWNHFIKE